MAENTARRVEVLSSQLAEAESSQNVGMNGNGAAAVGSSVWENVKMVRTDWVTSVLQVLTTLMRKSLRSRSGQRCYIDRN